MALSSPVPAPSCSPCMGESETKRQQILTGASSVFAEHGYEGASMSAIARQAGVSKGTLYNYFANKADLFAAFVEQRCREKLPVALAPVRENAPPREILTAVARAMVRLITQPDSLMLYRIIVSEAPRFPQLGAIFWENGPRVAIATLANWIREQEARGTLTTEDPVFAAEQFFALCQTRIAHLRRFNLSSGTNSTDEEKVIHAAVKVFMAAYGSK
ncbi:MAG: TetR/AcrR family transcriptional regulator [Acetobacter syzygii]|uniref:TetR/AcrR family transcriptional regulator C-terminal domain-containing protein n=1 Tax=Acetobacter syzygii TaxID=146476 RepID=UPI0039EAA557